MCQSDGDYSLINEIETTTTPTTHRLHNQVTARDNTASNTLTRMTSFSDVMPGVIADVTADMSMTLPTELKVVTCRSVGKSLLPSTGL